MKSLKFLLGVGFCFFTSLIIQAQAPEIEWQRCLGGTVTEDANFIQPTPDGGYIAVGTATSNDGDVSGNHGLQDAWIVKLNYIGYIQWQKCYGGTKDDALVSIISTSDGGYITVGNTTSNDGDVSGNHGGDDDIWVVKLTSTGIIQWQKSIGGTDRDVAKSIQPTLDGGYIVTGYTYSNDGDVNGNHGHFDVLVVKLMSTGSIQWQKCLGGTNSDFANSSQSTSDGGCIVAGYTYSNDGDVNGNHDNSNMWVVKLTSTGSIQWQKCLGGKAYSIKSSPDGGYILAGAALSNDTDIIGNHGSSDMWVMKLSATGGIEWQKCLGGIDYDVAFYTQPTSDGGYIVTGHTYSNDGDVSGNHGDRDMWVVKLSASGNIQWQKCLGGKGFDIANSIQIISNGGYILAGGTFSNDGDVIGNHGGYDMWVVKLSPEIKLDVFNLNPVNSIRKNIGYKHSNPTKIASDGSACTVFKVTGNFKDFKFRLKQDTSGLDTVIYGGFKILHQSTDSLVVQYRHPTYLNAPPIVLEATFDLELYNTQTASVVASYPVKVIRPPVLLIPGLWSAHGGNAQIEIKKYLSAFDMYPKEIKDYVSIVNYQSDRHFSEMLPEIILQKNNLINYCINNRVSCGKVDIVAHSMGGIMARLYLQSPNYKNDINRLITLNTPHSGSQMANVLLNPKFNGLHYTFKKILNYNPDNGAVTDLRVNSKAILDNLNGKQNLNANKVSSHVIGTREEYSVFPSSTKSNYWEQIALKLALLFDGGVWDIKGEVFKGDDHDLVVALGSQMGGLSAPSKSFFDRQWHSSTSNPLIQQTVRDLLNTDPNSSVFTKNGFNPTVLGANFFPVNPSKPKTEVPGIASTSTLDIISPTEGKIFSDKDSVKVEVLGSADIKDVILVYGSQVANAYGMYQAFSSGVFSFTIPKEAIGEFNMIALGFGDRGFLAMDTAFIFVNPMATLDSIAIDNAFISIPQSHTTTVNILGYYNNIVKTISYLPSISYTFKQGLASHYQSNTIKGLTIGSDTLTVSYNGKLASAPVTITDSTDWVVIHIDTGLVDNISYPFGNKGELEFSIFPNPNNGNFTLTTEIELHDAMLEITDVTGRLVYVSGFSSLEANNLNNLDISHLSDGLYFIKLFNDEFTGAQKLVVRK